MGATVYAHEGQHLGWTVRRQEFSLLYEDHDKSSLQGQSIWSKCESSAIAFRPQLDSQMVKLPPVPVLVDSMDQVERG